MKKRIRLLSMILSLSLSLCGCNNSKDIDSIEPLTLEEIVIDDKMEETEEEKTLITEHTDAVNPGIVDEYLDYFDDITYNYKGEEYYLSDSELDEIIDVGNTIKTVNHNNVSTDPYEVFESIKANSDLLLETRDDLESCFTKGDDYSQEFQVFFESTLYHILSVYYKNETNDIKEDFCKFNDLAICSGNLDKILDNDNEELGLLGYYDEENNAIILDVESIYEVYDGLFSWYDIGEQNYANLYDVIMTTLTHEMNHVRQHACDCRIDAGQEYSSVGYYCDYVPTIIESSAESSIYNKQDYLSQYVLECQSRDFTYEEEREFECFIILLGLLSNDTEDYYNAIYDSDINKLYEFTGCDTKEEIDRLYHILYNIDGLMVRNDLVFDIGGNEISAYDLEKLVGNEFSYEVLNIFTESLIKYVSTHGDMSSIDALTLFIMAENLSLNHTSYCESDDNEFITTNYDKDLVNNINNTRIHFENFIMEYYGLTDEELYLAVLRASLVVNSKHDFLFEDSNESKNEYREKLDELMLKFPLMNAIYDGSHASTSTYQYVYTINDIDYKLH